MGARRGRILWFCGLGFGARYASPLLARPRAWQVLDVVIGVVMLLIAAPARARLRSGPSAGNSHSPKPSRLSGSTS